MFEYKTIVIILLIIVIVYLYYKSWDATSYLVGIWSSTDEFAKTADIGSMALYIHPSLTTGNLTIVSTNGAELYNDKIYFNLNMVRLNKAKLPIVISTLISTPDHIMPTNVVFELTSNLLLRIHANDILYGEFTKLT
jgi:hypothetical protein